MKILYFLVLGFAMPFGGQSQTYLPVEENNLILGQAPQATFSGVSKQLLTTALEAFKQLKVEYRYINGSCEDRAHFLAAFLKSRNIFAAKIWNFAPAKFTPISKQLFHARDPLNVQPNISWGYHVAPVVVAGGDTLVIDFSFSPAPMLQKEWLAKMNCPSSIYFYTDAGAYLFNTLNGLTVFDNRKNPAPPGVKLPDFLPSVLSGDFWTYTPSNTFIEEGLAVNDLAVFAVETFKQKPDRDKIVQLVSNIDTLEKFAMGTTNDLQLQAATVQRLRSYYGLRRSFWRDEINKLQSHMP